MFAETMMAGERIAIKRAAAQVASIGPQHRRLVVDATPTLSATTYVKPKPQARHKPPTSLPQDTPESPKKPRSEKQQVRDDLFDAVMKLTADPKGNVGRAVTALLSAVPPYTADDVERFGRECRTLLPWMDTFGIQHVDCWFLTKRISALRGAAVAPPRQPRPLSDRDRPELQVDDEGM